MAQQTLPQTLTVPLGAAIVPSEYNGDVRDLPPVYAPQHPYFELNDFELPLPHRLPPATRPSNAPSGLPPMELGPMPSPNQNFAGLGRDTTVMGGKAGAGYPPDTNGDVGPNHYIQSVNESYGIFSKTGTLIAAFTENQLWSMTATGTPCDSNHFGDPVVIYDSRADRWILTDFAFVLDSGGNPVPPFYQCFAVSKTGDPVAGGWWFYAVHMDPGGNGAPPANTFADYPKFGVWTQCLFMGANGFDSTGNYAGAVFAAFDRTALYSGAALDPTNSSMGYISANQFSDPFSMFPAHLLGTPPSATTPGYFVYVSGENYALEVRKFQPGTTACGAGSSLSTNTEIGVDVYGFPADQAQTTLDIIPQKSTAIKLDSLGDRLMQRVVYRKVGSTESLWVVHTTCGPDISNGTCVSDTTPTQPQWVQIDVTGGTISTTPVQQQLYAPNTKYRWVPSLAVDYQGNMALGYSFSSANSFPSIAYSGRLVGDPLNELPQTETVLIAGGGAQTNKCGGKPCHRWGDYSAMTIDPVDDCTFWFTTEYYDTLANGSNGVWQTRIGSFKFPGCVQPSQPPVLSITSIHSDPFVQGDTSDTYKLTVRNIGVTPTNGLNVDVGWTIPAGLTLTGYAGIGWGCAGGQCSRNDVLNPGASYPPITVTVSVDSNALGTVSYLAGVSGGGAANASTSDPTHIVVPDPDLIVTKHHTTNFVQGDTGDTYTLLVINAGNTRTDGSTPVIVTDKLPPGLTAASPTAISGTGWTCVQATLSCTRSDILASGGVYDPITVTVDVASNAPATVVNTAHVSGGGDSYTSDNDASDSTTIFPPGPDLVVTQTLDGPVYFVQGDTSGNDTFTIHVSNNGSKPTDGSMVTVTDTLSAGLSLHTPPPQMSGTGWTCDQNTLTCTRSDMLANGSSYPPITVVVDVANNAPSTVVSTAQVSGGGNIITSNDLTSSQVTVIAQAPDLILFKAHNGSFTQGQIGATYTLTVLNQGQSPTAGTVTVTDALPTGLSATAISGSGWTCVLSSLACTRNDPLGGFSNYPDITVTVTVAGDAPPLLTNIAYVSGGGQTNASNDSVQDPTVVIAPGSPTDLVISKKHIGPNYLQGGSGEYLITVTNAGSSPTDGSTVTVVDTLPAGLTATSIGGASGWACDLPTLTCTISDVLGSGQSYPLIGVFVAIDGDAPPSVINRAAVSGGGDNDGNNNTAQDVTTIAPTAPDLVIAKTHSGKFVQGGVGAYTLIVTNNGSNPTDGSKTVTVTDTLPPGLTAATPTAISGTGWTCVQTTPLTCTRSDTLPGHASYSPITVNVSVDPQAAPLVTNTAYVSGGGETNTGNDSAQDQTVVTSPPGSPADLIIQKTHISGSFVKGGTGTYTITVSNAGGSVTSGTVTVTDTLPTGLTATQAAGASWSCSVDTNTNSVTCSRADALGKGASYPAITVNVGIDPQSPDLMTNTAHVSGGAEIDTTNNDAPDPTVVVSPSGSSPSLVISKTHSGSFTQGDIGDIYTIVVSNAGNAATSGMVTVTDTLPGGLTAIQAPSGANGWSCNVSANTTLTCTRSDALSGGGQGYPPILFAVNVDNTAVSTTNTASVSGGNSSSASVDDPTQIDAPSSAVRLVFSTQPVQGANIGRGIGTDLVVDVLDANDVLVGGDNGRAINLTINACSNPNYVLGNSTTSGGKAQFSNIRFYTVANSLALSAQASGLITAGSNGFNVVANADMKFWDGFESCVP